MSDVTGDPRAATATVIDGPPGLLGPVELYRPFDIDGRTVALPKILPGVPEYITVARAEAAALDFRSHLLDALDERNGEIPFATNTGVVFGFYASVGTTVTEAISGLEDFANYLIGGQVGATSTFTLGSEEYTQRQLYDMPINERFDTVLPAMFGVEAPTAAPWWQTFRRVQGLAALKRHGVYDAVPRKGLTGEKELVQRFVDGEYRGAAKMMLDAIGHIQPTWISPERLAQLPPSP